MNSGGNFNPIAPGVSIGHVHLKVADLNARWDFTVASWALNSRSASGRRRRLFLPAAIITISA